jgi:hypothetical protein
MYIHVFLEFFETFLVGLHGVWTKTWFAFDMFPSRKAGATIVPIHNTYQQKTGQESL